MINNVVLTGRLTKDVDLRYTSNGTAVGSFTVAVDRQFKSQSGERETDFINCVMWRKAAENFANFTRKGSLVGIQGRIQTRNYENQQGQRVYVTEIVADNFTLLESRNVTEQRPRETESSIKIIINRLTHLITKQTVLMTTIRMKIHSYQVANQSTSQMTTCHSNSE